MSRLSRAVLILGCTLIATAAGASDDALLRKVIVAYEIKAHVPANRSLGPKERLGQALFFDPIVSGPKSIACAACHVRSLGAGDGLPMAVGLGAEGVSKERTRAGSAFIIPRNALPFFNRGSNEFVAFFWDGRVQLGVAEPFESPLGRNLPAGFESLLAVAAVFPLAEPDEMLGRSDESVSSDVAPRVYHGGLVGPGVDGDNFMERTRSVFQRLVTRLLDPTNTNPDAAVRQYRDLFQAAYPTIKSSQIGMPHIGNALAAYIGVAFEVTPAAWDRYVVGETDALTVEQKKGALLFYGKGRCAVCHSGTQFSDFRFHGLAIPQGRVGKHGANIDYGRAAVTGRGEDRFLFRTPPLRNATVTGPWGHNGSFTTLDAIIEHHVDPVPMLYAARQDGVTTSERPGQLLGFRSPVLAEIPPLSRDDVGRIKQFLAALTSSTVMRDEVAVPADVPSGQRTFIRK